MRTEVFFCMVWTGTKKTVSLLSGQHRSVKIRTASQHEVQGGGQGRHVNQ